MIASLNEALELSQAGKIEEALVVLKTHADQSATYYYNVGTLSMQLGHSGEALAYLEKAKKLKPHDSDIQQNLNIARASLARVLGTERLDPASTWVESLADHMPLDEIRGTLGLVGLILAIFWIRSYLKTRNLRKTFLYPAALFSLVAFGVTGVLYGAQRLAEAHPPAVCLERQTIRSGPGDQFIALAQVEAGTKIRLLGPTDSQWAQVRYAEIATPEVNPDASGGKVTETRIGETRIGQRIGQRIGWIKLEGLLPL